MSNSLQFRVLGALTICLRPLARVLLRSGISYRQFSEAAKLAFVEEALGEKDQRGRVRNTSRVAIKTGLSRKQVAILRRQLLAGPGDGTVPERPSNRSSHAARVLQLWHVHPMYLESNGVPKSLPVTGDGETLATLVKMAGGDVPPGAVRAELLAASAVEELPDGHLVPLRRYFIPGDVGEDLVVGLTHILSPVLEGLAYNTGPGRKNPFVQRLAYSDRLIPEAVPLFRQLARARAGDFLQAMDDWLSSNEQPANGTTNHETRVGIGVFYYEGARMDIEGASPMQAVAPAAGTATAED